MLLADYLEAGVPLALALKRSGNRMPDAAMLAADAAAVAPGVALIRLSFTSGVVLSKVTCVNVAVLSTICQAITSPLGERGMPDAHWSCRAVCVHSERGAVSGRGGVCVAFKVAA